MVDYQQFFQKEENQYRLRGHSSKVFIPSVRTNLRKSFFSHRALDSWNRLARTVVDADIVQTFKSRYDRVIQDYGKLKLISFSSHHPQVLYKNITMVRVPA